MRSQLATLLITGLVCSADACARPILAGDVPSELDLARGISNRDPASRCLEGMSGLAVPGTLSAAGTGFESAFWSELDQGFVDALRPEDSGLGSGPRLRNWDDIDPGLQCMTYEQYLALCNLPMCDYLNPAVLADIGTDLNPQSFEPVGWAVPVPGAAVMFGVAALMMGRRRRD